MQANLPHLYNHRASRFLCAIILTSTRCLDFWSSRSFPFPTGRADKPYAFQASEDTPADFVQVIEALENIAQFSKKNEPETTRYAIFTSRNEADENNLWVIEEYALLCQQFSQF